MRRLAALSLAVLLLFCGCGKAEDGKAQGETAELDQGTYNALAAAVDGFNAQDTRQTSVIIGMKDGEESKYFNQGTYAYRRADPIAMSGKCTEIYGGGALTMDVYYKAGAYYYSHESEKYYESFDRELFLKQYLCTNISLCAADKVTALRTAQTPLGTKYELSAIDEDIFNSLFGDIILTYSGIKKLQRDKTKYADGKFILVLDGNGNLAAVQISCKVTLYDTPAYYPTGYTPTEAELTRSYSLSYELDVKALGEDVEITAPETKDFEFLG